MLIVLILLASICILLSMLGTILQKIMNSLLNNSLMVERVCALKKKTPIIYLSTLNLCSVFRTYIVKHKL